jgi:ATP-dependent Clp protease adaptor protein ClpS
MKSLGDRLMDMICLATPTVATAAPAVAPSRSSQVTPKLYPNYKVIVLNDDFNTFQHVADCLMKYIPGMTGDRAWELTHQVHNEGQATVWVGPQEQAELYHVQLSRAGLTMAPLEKA